MCWMLRWWVSLSGLLANLNIDMHLMPSQKYRLEQFDQAQALYEDLLATVEPVSTTLVLLVNFT